MHAHYAVLCRLSNPTATLYGYDANNTGHAIVLSLASPSASPADKVRRPLAISLLCIHHPSILLVQIFLFRVGSFDEKPCWISEVGIDIPGFRPVGLSQPSWTAMQGCMHA